MGLAVEVAVGGGGGRCRRRAATVCCGSKDCLQLDLDFNRRGYCPETPHTHHSIAVASILQCVPCPVQ
jgi:hypothetical protein